MTLEPLFSSSQYFKLTRRIQFLFFNGRSISSYLIVDQVESLPFIEAYLRLFMIIITTMESNLLE